MAKVKQATTIHIEGNEFHVEDWQQDVYADSNVFVAGNKLFIAQDLAVALCGGSHNLGGLSYWGTIGRKAIYGFEASFDTLIAKIEAPTSRKDVAARNMGIVEWLVNNS